MRLFISYIWHTDIIFAHCHNLIAKMEQPNNPLHCITLEAILNHLVAHYGWEEKGARISINCFNSDPTIKSSLRFLRATPWARKKVEDLYLESIGK